GGELVGWTRPRQTVAGFRDVARSASRAAWCARGLVGIRRARERRSVAYLGAIATVRGAAQRARADRTARAIHGGPRCDAARLAGVERTAAVRIAAVAVHTEAARATAVARAGRPIGVGRRSADEARSRPERDVRRSRPGLGTEVEADAAVRAPAIAVG